MDIAQERHEKSLQYLEEEEFITRNLKDNNVVSITQKGLDEVARFQRRNLNMFNLIGIFINTIEKLREKGLLYEK